MTIAELIEHLRRYPGELLVVLSEDSEGNRFSPLEDISRGNYEPDSTYSGEFESTADVDEEGAAVCLWPIS